MSKRKEDQEINYKKINKGEYELHVLVESTSGLSLEEDSSIDVKIGITSFAKTEYTKVKNNIGVEETFWGEHFYFEKTFDDSNKAENERLLISVYNYSKVFANSLVGSFELDVQRIYSEKNHTIQHIWLALSNSEKHFAEITGYVKISASVLGETDQNVELEVEPIASITKEKQVLVPPQIERKTYQVIIEALEGKDIKPADGKTVNSYIGVEFGQIYSVSQTIAKNCNPKYRSKIFLPLALPAVGENIAFRLNDFNFIQKVEVLGSYYLNINELLKSTVPLTTPAINYNKSKEPNSFYQLNDKLPIGDFRWINFYGPQLKTKRAEEQNVQQFFPSLAPFYVGSALIRVSIREDLEPVSRNEILEEEFVKKYDSSKYPPIFYTFTASITAALNLFNKNKKYKVQIRVGAEELETDFSQAKNGFCFWNVRKSYTVTVEYLQMVPDVFVYLIDEKNVRVCYQRFTPKEGILLEDQWVKLIPDLAVVDLKNEQAGFLKIAIDMIPTNRKEQPLTRTIGSPLAGLYNSNRKSGILIIDLLCCEGLIPLDEDGSIDSFFVFDYMQSQVTSTVKNDTLNPVFYERLVIETDIHDEEGCPPIIINAYDKDKLHNEFLGSTFIDIGEAIKNKSLVYSFNKNPEPYWYSLTQNGLESGRFLLTFRLVPNYSQSIPKEINLPKKTYEMTLVILGLRGLKSTGVISVKQPFVEFDFGSLQVYAQNVSNSEVKNNNFVKTEPKEKGRSVNISSIIPSKIVLPENHKFWPSLSARVKDNVLGNFYEPVLGYFSINLQDSFTRSNHMREEFKKRKAVVENKTKITQKPEKLASINENLILSLRNFIIKSLNYNWKILESGMEKKLNKLNGNSDKKLKINEDYVVIFPHYEKMSQGRIEENGKNNSDSIEKFKYVEKDIEIIKNNKEYMQIGFDDNKKRALPLDKRNKHYRFVLNEPYEKYYERAYGVKMGILDEIPIRVGRVFASNDLVSNVIRKVSQEDMLAGTYKGQLFIREFKSNRDSELDEFRRESMNVLNTLTRKGKVHLYLYIIEAANLPQKDSFSNSDPYIVVRTGNQKLSFEKEYFEDEPNPQFLKKVHLILEFPLDSTVEIEIWDYDPIKADELIGSCHIDIENRLESTLTDSHWNNPIETHNLYNETSKRPQGLLRFWFDLVPIENISLYREFEIANKPAGNFEVRIIIWGVKGMPNNDIEDMSDLFVQCELNGETQETDVHYRSATGEGNFNWRMCFPLKLPIKNNILSLKVVDKDIITSNDYLASGSFSIEEYLQEAFETDTSVTLFLGTEDLAENSDVKTSKMHRINGKNMYDRFNIGLMNKLQAKKPNNELNKQGEVEVSIEILTEAEAKRKPAGKGRSDPNQHPYLPQPKKRFEFSLNPMTMISQICGPKFKKQVCIALVVLLLLGLIIAFAVTFGGSVVGSLVGSRAAT